MIGRVGDIFFFFFNDTATTEIYTLSLHDALPICPPDNSSTIRPRRWSSSVRSSAASTAAVSPLLQPRSRPWCGNRRSEEHTSELQSRQYLVCRLLLEKKKIHISKRKRNQVQTAPV